MRTSGSPGRGCGARGSEASAADLRDPGKALGGFSFSVLLRCWDWQGTMEETCVWIRKKPKTEITQALDPLS